MADKPIIITAKDFEPLWADPNYMQGAIESQERAMVAIWEDNVRQATLNDPARPPEEMAPTGDRQRGDRWANPQQAQQMQQRDRFLRLGFTGSRGMHHGVSVGGGTGPNSSFLMLFDEDTNQLLAMMDTDYFGAVRVGAEGGLGAKHLAKGAKVLGFLGSGYQARTAMPAMVAAVPTLEQIKVYSTTKENRERFSKEMQDWLGVEITPVDSVEAAIGDADIIDQVHSSREPIFKMSQVKPGATIMSVTGRGQIPPEIINTARMVTPSWDVLSHNVLREPYYSAIKAGTYTKEDYGGEFGEIIAKGLDPRRDPSEIIDFHVLLVPLLNHAVADWAYRWARENGAGTEISISERAPH
jgi:ornithine cyclodeaminase/alanine dehydrogenase-like protein (mu-crystallin family)